MLREFPSVRQIPGEGFRRWFTDEQFDLYVWYESRSARRVVGFQLCYDKQGRQKALTWYRDRGYLHTAVDDGESSPLKNRTPILVADGVFPRDRITALFREAAASLDTGLAELVAGKLAAYPEA